MTITVFAISTTGLPNMSRGVDHPEQPRIVAMSALMFSAKWTEQGAFHAITKVAGVSSGDARAVHGVTERERELFGVEPKAILAFFMRMVRLSKEVAAFNFEFARFMIDIEIHHLDVAAPDWRRGGLQRTCILTEAGQKFNAGRMMTIPAAHEAATGMVYEQPARAKHISDARAAARVLQEIRK